MAQTVAPLSAKAGAARPDSHSAVGFAAAA
jgi:hypothetical protein